jgi:PIN domain nuclease of toxin-antitoxin system
MPISEYAGQLQQLGSLEILSVGVQSWLDNLDLDWEHRDPADRTIVALAKRMDCPLITSDRIIADYYPETIW